MTQTNMYKRHRLPREIFQYAVLLYHRFSLSHQDIKDLLAQRGMRNIKSMEQAQRFLGAHAAVHNLFNIGRHLVSAENYRYFRPHAFASWEKAAEI